MRKLFFFLLCIVVLQPAIAATSPVHPYAAELNPVFIPTETITPSVPIKKERQKKQTIFQKVKMKLLLMGQSKGLLLDGEMTVMQKRQAKWALILGLGSIILLFLPYVGLLAIPSAIIGLVLGIKSVEGNSNTNGIIGIIASGLTLLLLLIAIALVATLLATWN